MFNKMVLSLTLYLILISISIPLAAEINIEAVSAEREGNFEQGLSNKSTNSSELNSYGPAGENETIWSIANSLRPEGVSIEQMLFAIKKVNPNAFVDGNLNYLKKNSILVIPDTIEILKISKEAAAASFQKQQSEWESQKNTLKDEGSSKPNNPISKGLEPKVIKIKESNGTSELDSDTKQYSIKDKKIQNNLEESVSESYTEETDDKENILYNSDSPEISAIQKIEADFILKNTQNALNKDFDENQNRNPESKENSPPANNQEKLPLKADRRGFFEISNEIKKRYFILNKNLPEWPIVFGFFIITLLLISNSKKGKKKISAIELSSQQVKKRMNPYLNDKDYDRNLSQTEKKSSNTKDHYISHYNESNNSSPKAIFQELIGLQKQLEKIQLSINSQGDRLVELKHNLDDRGFQQILENELKQRGFLPDSFDQGDSKKVKQDKTKAIDTLAPNNHTRDRLEDKLKELEGRIDLNRDQFFNDEPLSALIADLGSSESIEKEAQAELRIDSDSEKVLDEPINLEETFNNDKFEQTQTSEKLSNTAINDSKLELAKVYIEMDDFDGAKGILNEILDTGSQEEKQKAKILLDEI
tara:strand:- start:1686 stop:3455 length:1770 start_codon:yes stop_codon:yes gene_type:complete